MFKGVNTPMHEMAWQLLHVLSELPCPSVGLLTGRFINQLAELVEENFDSSLPLQDETFKPNHMPIVTPGVLHMRGLFM